MNVEKLFFYRILNFENNVCGKDLHRHGSTIHGIIDFMPSRPKGWNMSVGQMLWIDHRDIDIYFSINETGRFEERYEIVVPGYLYQKSGRFFI